MPVTLTAAAKNSPANVATVMKTTTTTATISNTKNLEANNKPTTVKTTTTKTATTATAGALAAATPTSTCTFIATNGDFLYQNNQRNEQQKQQQQQQQQQHFYRQPPPPSTLNSTVVNSSVANNTLTSFPSFNGNSVITMANGNITGNTNNNNNTIKNNNSSNSNINNGNSNSSVVDNSASANAAELEISTITTSTAGTSSSSLSSSSTVTIGSGPVSIIKKTATSSTLQQQQQLHASREDGASSVNSQLSNSNQTSNNNCNGIMNAINNNNNNNSSSSNNAAKNNTNNNSKGSKENLADNTFYNGAGSGSAGSIEGGSISGGGAGGSVSSRNTETDDPGDGLGPLPPKWETAYTERGELYFIDHNTGTSHWLDPRLSKYQKKSLEDCGDDELPYGWEKIEDALYGTYFIDHVNRRTQYENPVLEAKRRAAEQNQQKHQHQQKHHHQQQQTHEQQRTQTPIMRNSPSILSGGKMNAINTSPSKLMERRPPHPPPPLANLPDIKSAPMFPYKFTRNPAEMQGERITTTLIKSKRGLGIKIVGGDDGIEEFLQIKSIVPNGPAWQDGQLQSGDVLVYVNDTCVLGFTHHEMVNVFQSILPGDSVTLEICRGYPLPFDPNDPNTEVVTTIAVETEPEKQRRLLMDLNLDGSFNFNTSIDSNKLSGVSGGGGSIHQMYHPKTSDGFILMKKPEIHTFTIVKGAMGFGFTIADSGFGQKVKNILDRNCCTHLQEGDVLLEINNASVRGKSHLEVVQMLKDCSKSEPTIVKIQRAAFGNSMNALNSTSISPNGGNVAKLRKNFIGNTATGLFRSKTPTADIYSTQPKEILPMRPKTPLVDTRRARVKTPNNELNDAEVAAMTGEGVAESTRTLAESKSQVDGKSTNSLQEIDVINQDIPFMDPYPKLVTSLSERLAEVGLRDAANNSRLGYHSHVPLRSNYENQEYVTASNHSGSYNPIYGLTSMPPPLQLNSVQFNRNEHGTTPLPAQLYTSPTTPASSSVYQQHQPLSNSTTQHYPHGDACNCYDCLDYRGISKVRQPPTQPYYGAPYTNGQFSPGTLQAAHIQNERMQKRVNDLLNDRRRVGFSPLDAQMLGTGTSVTTLPAGYLHHHQQQQQLSPAISSISQQQQQQYMPTQPWTSPNFNAMQPMTPIDSNMSSQGNSRNGLPLDVSDETEQYELSEVTLERQALGFGFRIVGGTEEGSQVTVGHVVPGGAADNDHRINTGDEILSIDGVNVVNSSHHKVVSLMGEAALRGQVSMILRRRLNPRPYNDKLPATSNFEPQPMPLRPGSAGLPGLLRHYPYDVIVSRHENEGFGFVIISSSNQYYGSTIGKLIPGSPAERYGELKVGDRIVAVNRVEIAGMSHGEVVNLIKESGLHVRLTIGSPSEISTVVGGGLMQASPGQHSQSLSTGGADSSSLYFDRPSTHLSTGSLSPRQTQQQQHHQYQLQQSQQQPQLRL